MNMKTPPDIVLTLVGDDFDGYRVKAGSEHGAAFISAHLPNHTPETLIPAAEARQVADKAERCGLHVLIE